MSDALGRQGYEVVLEGGGGRERGPRWCVMARANDDGTLQTKLQYLRGDEWVTVGGFGGPAVYGDSPVNTWTGRADGTVDYLVVRTSPLVSSVTVASTSGEVHEVDLTDSDVFGVRFGAAACEPNCTFDSIRYVVDDHMQGLELRQPG